jgi:hypothetical protein
VCVLCRAGARFVHVLGQGTGAWLGVRVHGVEDAVHREQRIMNGVEEAGFHGGVDGSRLDKAEWPGGVAFVRTESSQGAAPPRL